MFKNEFYSFSGRTKWQTKVNCKELSIKRCIPIHKMNANTSCNLESEQPTKWYAKKWHAKENVYECQWNANEMETSFCFIEQKLNDLLGLEECKDAFSELTDAGACWKNTQNGNAMTILSREKGWTKRGLHRSKAFGIYFSFLYFVEFLKYTVNTRK